MRPWCWAGPASQVGNRIFLAPPSDRSERLDAQRLQRQVASVDFRGSCSRRGVEARPGWAGEGDDEGPVGQDAGIR
jgi:hypothetical protein